MDLIDEPVKRLTMAHANRCNFGRCAGVYLLRSERATTDAIRKISAPRTHLGGWHGRGLQSQAFGVEGFEKIIAIKKILPSMAEDADFIQMFIDEAKICGQLNHANICQIFELGRIDGSHFIAMEYIWGRTCSRSRTAFAASAKNMMTVQMAVSRQARCARAWTTRTAKDATGKPLNIIHRDVSPQNVIVSYEGEVKVIDFGIAKAASRSAKTQAGVLKGQVRLHEPGAGRR